MIYPETLLKILREEGMLTAKIIYLVEERFLPCNLRKLCKKVAVFESGVAKLVILLRYILVWCR